MRVGLTYDLKSEYAAHGLSEEQLAELDREDTILGIERVFLGGLGRGTPRPASRFLSQSSTS